MAPGDPRKSMSATIGFVSVRLHAEHGYFGGYLVLNQRARPLEFHCTLPVKPSRAQVLLYGPTLDEFVCGEQIARALVTKAKLKPDLVVVDSAAALGLSNVSDLPVVHLANEIASSTLCERLAIPSGQAGESPTRDCLTVGKYRFGLPAGGRVSNESLNQVLSQLANHFDLREPFQRIVEALVEAHPIAKAA
jgi:hypothetical protein